MGASDANGALAGAFDPVNRALRISDDGLSSMPTPQAGDAGKVVTVNNAEDGFELDTPTSGASVPVPTTGDAGKVVTVNGAEDGYELDTPSGGGTVLGTAQIVAFSLTHGTIVRANGTAYAALTWPAQHYAPGIVLTPGNVEFAVDAHTSPGGFGLALQVFVKDIAGVDSADGITPGAAVPPGPYAGGSVHLDLVANPPSITGTDLSVDMDGNLVSAAGGVYSIVLLGELSD